MKKFLVIFLTFQIFVSCSLNKLFLGPFKNQNEQREFKWNEGNDLFSLKYYGDNFQPEFKKNNQIIEKPFTIESVIFKSKNGNLLNGWFLKPKNIKPKVTLFHLHGNAGNLSTQLSTISDLTKDGFQIFMFDYSGYGYSTGNATRENCLNDSFSAFEFFINNHNVKDTKILIYGQSLGGNLAIPLAKDNQNKIEGLVLEGTFLNAKNIGGHYLPIIGNLIVKNDFDNKRNIKEFRKPILVVHSKEDKVIPIKLGKKIYEKANEKKEFYEVTGSHINANVKYHKEIAEKIYAMIN
ncbi:MAG: alpha/beta fold hydrolase [Bacteroidetes bacterium]|nr:alpha/beta fold hydrolase [Bacteroidota bacterium]